MGHLNPYAPPSEAADVDAPERAEAHAFWREGTMLVVSRSGVRLPDRCVRCNAWALGYRIKQTVRRHDWPLAPFGASHSLEVGLCQKHRSLRNFGRVLLIGGLFSPALVVLGVDWWLGMPLFAGGIVAGFQLLRVVRAGRIDAQYARIKVGTEFLLSIPSRLPGRQRPAEEHD